MRVKSSLRTYKEVQLTYLKLTFDLAENIYL